MSTIDASDDLTPLQLDPKRYLWLFAAFWGFVPIAFMYTAHATGNGLWIWGYFVFIFMVMPTLDKLMGPSSYNPPESAFVKMRDDSYYKWLARFTAISPFFSQLAGAWYIATYEPGYGVYFGFAWAAGWALGLSVNAAHEVGHKSGKIDHFFASLGLAPSFMGHFRIEHNNGHHIQVATPQDTATSRMGQNFYSFVLTELPGGFSRAWNIEKKRLSKKGILQFSLKNEVFRNALVSMLYYAVMIYVFGLVVLPFLLIAALMGNLLLSSANYIEHYGLKRAKLENGKYERCQPHHSWNSNRYLSNLLVLHLERHSDHHAHAQRPYQCLRHFDEVPQLPSGYLPMFFRAWIPPWWFSLMDKRVADWAGGDMNKVMIQEGKEEEMFAKWHRPKDDVAAAE